MWLLASDGERYCRKRAGLPALTRSRAGRRPRALSTGSAAVLFSLTAALNPINAVAAAAEKKPIAHHAANDGTAETTKVADTKMPVQHFDIDEFRVDGADALKQIEVEESVYPFMGPNRTLEDVEKARATLEKAYAAKGYQTVSVSVPPQKLTNGTIVLKVTEMKVGRLNVKNSRYFDLEKIKAKAPSVAENKLPNINAVTKDIYALNQWPDRKVTPVLRAGVTPGTVDVDLNVDDTFPLHAKVELNNSQSPNTKPLRLNTNVHYDNLWQRGDSINFSYQVAPQRPSDVTVYSGSYLARTDLDWLNILVYGVDSKSSVATVGGINVVGPGQIIGARAVMTLPTLGDLFHTISIGADYKSFQENVSQGSTLAFSTPVDYVPAVASYSATWQHSDGTTQFDVGVNLGIRGIGSDPFAFDAKRYKAAENFAVLHGSLSHTQNIPFGFQVFGKMQGQLADQPLVSSEEFSLGGTETVRGYLESEALGDQGVAGTFEVRTPNIASLVGGKVDQSKTPALGPNELRFFGFTDAGRAGILSPLPGQQSVFDLASYGVGVRASLLGHSNAMVVLANPLIGSAFTSANDPRVLFRISGEF